MTTMQMALLFVGLGMMGLGVTWKLLIASFSTTLLHDRYVLRDYSIVLLLAGAVLVVVGGITILLP